MSAGYTGTTDNATQWQLSSDEESAYKPRPEGIDGPYLLLSIVVSMSIMNRLLLLN